MPTGSAPSRCRLLLFSAAAMATAAAIALALIASGYPGNDEVNYALVDTGGTAEVTTQARDLVETAFSFTPDTVKATRRAAAGSLTGTAVRQYDKLYGDLLDQASERRLSMRTSVASIGVQRLNEDRATASMRALGVTTTYTPTPSASPTGCSAASSTPTWSWRGRPSRPARCH